MHGSPRVPGADERGLDDDAVAPRSLALGVENEDPEPLEGPLEDPDELPRGREVPRDDDAWLGTTECGQPPGRHLFAHDSQRTVSFDRRQWAG